MWREFIKLLMHEDVVLVTIAQVKGSAPREAGASMLVSLTALAGTIGGGRLEWEAATLSRQMLVEESGPMVVRFPLAASLGQCCGGVVWLLFERMERGQIDIWRKRVSALEESAILRRRLSKEMVASHWEVDQLRADQSRSPRSLPPKPIEYIETEGSWDLHQSLTNAALNVAVFGAGHVGESVVRILMALDTEIVWVDTREDVFPGDLKSEIRCISSDFPEEEIQKLKPGAFVLIMTHSHAIDLDICEAALQRGDLAWVGLIGSRTKRNRFELRLQDRGLDERALEQLSCPIGVAGIRNKQPAAIAVSVVAQILQLREMHDAKQSASGSLCSEALPG